MKALVTGGASTIGAAIVRRLAADGMNIIVQAHSQIAAAEALAREISGKVLICDLTDIAATESALDPVLADGVPQILVHAAGVHDDVPLAGMNALQWRRVLGVSLDGFYAITKPLLLPMLATRWGRIIALSSVAARLGNRGQVNYAAAKAGLEGAVRGLAREIASRGITVNAVAPGIIASPATDAAFDAGAIARLVPMKRAGRPDEVADLIGFLASERAGYMTGQTITIDGGLS